MLKAIVSGKMAPWRFSTGETTSARAVYRDYEDHLTAAVFARLAYLPRSVFWHTVRESVAEKPPKLFAHEPCIENILFWPRLECEGDKDDRNRTTEPDVLIEFRTCSMLVEVKRNDGNEPHTPKQIQVQIKALDEEIKGKPVHVLLVSGQIVGNFEEVKGAASIMTMSWFSLRRAINNIAAELRDPIQHGHVARILNDIDLALDLHGVVPTLDVASIPQGFISRMEAFSSKNKFLWPSL